jgi:hypothetical protein
MAKIGFYVKTASLLLALAVSSLVGCGGGSFSSVDSDAGVTPGGQSSVVSTQSEATGGQSSVIGGQSSVIGGQSSVVGTRSDATGGTSSVDSQPSATGGSTTSFFYAAGYDQGTYLGGSILPQGISVGECPSNYVRTDCMCKSGGTNSFISFDGSCSESTLKNCITKSTCTNLTCPMYSYFWQCTLSSLKPSEIATTGGASSLATTGGASSLAATGGTASVTATGGSAAVVATGGSTAVATTGGSSAVGPTTYSVTYLNQVASQSVQAPGTCPSDQSVAACTCVISGMQSSLTSCNPTACAIENSKQYPQSTFTWTCV